MPVGLISVCLIIVICSALASYHAGNDRKKIEKFLEEENKTYIKSKDVLNDIKFIKVDFSDVKFKAKSSETKGEIKNLLSFSDMKIANYKGMTNNELKKKYGSNNFDDVLSYQTNYEDLLKQIRTTAECLIQDEDDKGAIAILNEAIDIGDDVTKSYTMLADLYAKNKMRKEMYHLVDTVKTNKNLSQKKIMNYISKLETTKKGDNK